MTSEELRKKFLNFFEKKGHQIVPSSSLIPTDPSVLFTTAGMQQFKEYFLGKKSHYGKKVVSCQKCLRTSDIEEVGNKRHLTFLEMLGNFSFGDYFKEEAIKLAFEFLIENCKLKIDELKFTYFKGDKEIPEDLESKKIWEKLGIPKNKIKKCGREDNFWGPTGEEGPCGPTTEIYFKDLEIWNLVFNEYYQDRNKKLTPLKEKGIDTGMGLERLAMAVQKKSSVFETDLFLPILRELNSKLKTQNVKPQLKTQNLEKAIRVIADHIKSSVFLISEDIFPSNVERGYILRRVLRRAIRYGKLLNLPKNFLTPLAQKAIEIYKNIYPEVKSKEADILTVIQNEEEKFEKTLEKGLKEFKLEIEKCKLKTVPGQAAFDLFQSYGFPLELTTELAKDEGFEVDKKGFQEALKKHQEISRAGVEKKFGGGGIEKLKIRQLHTATHLLQAALRKVLGPHVKQMGSDITSQRLRFDFFHPQKMTEEKIKKVEDLVNQKIKEDWEVKKEEMRLEEALKAGALSFAFFSARGGFAEAFGVGGKEKYPQRVTVYSINNFSKEICAGPHLSRTSQLGHFKIIKEESLGAGVRRIRATLK